MNLRQILKGCTIKYDGVQTISGLTILPLVCDKEFSLDEKYASPYAHNASTTTYGDVTVHRDPKAGDKIVLTPSNAVYIVDYQAQDHLISKAALIKKGHTARLQDSRCVQSSQGGLIRSNAKNSVFIAPMKIREVAYNYVGVNNYGQLWPDIAKFNQSTGAGSNQQLKDYFNKWNKELDTFIAHFERVDNCIGFITLFNDEVVAVDKFPSFTYTAEIWEKLVRDSYAALVIKAQLDGTKSNTKTVKDITADLALEAIYNQLVDSKFDHYKTLLEEIIDIDFKSKKDKDTEGSEIIEHEGYIGQVIEDSGVNVMVSIIKKEKFNPDKMREARALKKIASKQKEFKL